MIKKAPLPVGEEIRRLGYLDDGGWDIDAMDTAFARMRDRIGADNPFFVDVFMTFDYGREKAENFLSQLQADSERLWQYVSNLKDDYEEIYQMLFAETTCANSENVLGSHRERLHRIAARLEYLEGHVLEVVDPLFAQRAMKMLLMSCLRFMTVAMTAQWAKSPGRPPERIRGDKMSKRDYVAQAYLECPSAKVEVIWSNAEQAFLKAHPGKTFLTPEHVAKIFKKKFRQPAETATQLNLEFAGPTAGGPASYKS